ncbi:MAG: hypothetical protein H7Y02_11855 [Candidatus Obscuribacterales bacterium]|nr:hypothetical protein [Steroidobacteraceae bacterium]
MTTYCSRSFLRLGIMLTAAIVSGCSGPPTEETATTAIPLTTATTAAAPSAFTSTASNASPTLLVAVFMHSEDPHHPDTPDFMQDSVAYRSFRAALLDFAERMQLAGLAWNFQPDWNFLNGVIEYEIAQADVTLLASTANKNVLRYLHENLGVEIDPHSHENDGYNFADVAYLISQTGVTPAPVVGGHIYDPTDPNYQNWPRFIAGIACQKFTCPAWRAELLMGAGTSNHRNDPVVTGMWEPASATNYFHAGDSGIAAFGGWDHELTSLPALADQVQSGALDTNLLWTFALNVNHSDIVKPGYLTNTMQPRIDQLQQWQAAARIEVATFQTSLTRWRNDYGQRSSVYQREGSYAAAQYVNFALNTQDFAYPELSAALVTRVLDLHEQFAVPLDVFLTTTQVDVFETSYPALLQRLFSSPVVKLSYHIRAPKPFANNYDWRGLGRMTYDQQVALVTDYETHGLDLVTGLPTTASGGFQKLARLWGLAPRMCGTVWDPTFAQATSQVFLELGCSMVIQHGSATSPGSIRYGLLLKPEHVDFKLFEFINTDGGIALDAAIAEARTLAGTESAFVGVKMHDNDFFATQSAWTYVYQDGGTRRPNWDPTRKPALLSATEQNAMWTLYDQAVRHAAALRDAGRVQLVDADDLIALASVAGP